MADRVKTRYPGVYARGDSFTFNYRDRDGRQRWGTAPTAKAGQRLKGEAEERARMGVPEGSDAKLLAYLEEWVGRYQGNGRTGFRDATRAEYRRIIAQVYPKAFTPKERLAELDPPRVARFIAWCVKQGWKDQTIRNMLSPLRAACGQAVREGLIPSNPTRDAVLPHRPTVEAQEEKARPLTRAQVDILLASCAPEYRLLIRLAIESGLRVSELAGLETRHLNLTGSSPQVLVRQRFASGAMDITKSRYARRAVPLTLGTADELAALVAGRPLKKQVFSLPGGGRITPQSAREILKPALGEAGAEWAAWHTLRHTCASMLFDAGRNIVQVQKWLGHHSASFTLDTYVHLLDPGDLGEPIDLRAPSAVPV